MRVCCRARASSCCFCWSPRRRPRAAARLKLLLVLDAYDQPGHLDGPSRGGNATINETAALSCGFSKVNGSGMHGSRLHEPGAGWGGHACVWTRSSMFLLTKIPNVLTRSEMVAYVKKDIEQLGETPDVVLIHSPCSSGIGSHDCKYATGGDGSAWLGMEDALKDGLTRAIGVSIFNVNSCSRSSISAARFRR